jgi:hypothetical protein
VLVRLLTRLREVILNEGLQMIGEQEHFGNALHSKHCTARFRGGKSR